ncbi:ergothioneine biosynthesis glutamate--cysteine ligase EgtA [Streptomyces sp. TRM66268-LWL]|uniref:Glutamate--cysteine ligase EgtA n=1 Tax=Streptomyces polyasparticus TaxID=2767826 RepID=A0ABR7SQE0_9ACTN|nr:ergothioneine biosynthesis glutamate--cysteine ligase EgtA [Streptomyces polyasparticus]MBC9716741.1 ergothioneine biosynthesis glutamate--cysteine ligase EgtA [Streptomyces polyasparticus]
MSEPECTTLGGITEAEVEALVKGICFKTGPPRTVGVELEWIVHDPHRPWIPLPIARLDAACAALRALPLGSALTMEPGGQLELSSPPAATLSDCVSAMRADLTAVRATLQGHGLVLAGHGTDPWRPPRRVLRQPRYDALETSLDRAGPAGRAMMCSSASVQVCLDAGYEEPGPLGHGRRWVMSHLLGAVLVAAFANSPLLSGRSTGVRSSRQWLWERIDAGRSGAPPLDTSPRTAWARHVLDAPVMCVRADDGPWHVPHGLTFREWIRGGLPRPPTRSDLDYHLTTLFPPVRPRGHLELRMIDAQPGDDGWLVPAAVTTALFDDPAAAETAYRTVKPLAERAGPAPAPHNPLWRDAARLGLTDPELREAATVCFTLALDALARMGADDGIRQAVADFTERYVLRGRCPADDALDGRQDLLRVPPSYGRNVHS